MPKTCVNDFLFCMAGKVKSVYVYPRHIEIIRELETLSNINFIRLIIYSGTVLEIQYLRQIEGIEIAKHKQCSLR